MSSQGKLEFLGYSGVTVNSVNHQELIFVLKVLPNFSSVHALDLEMTK